MSQLKEIIENLDPEKLHILFVGGCGFFGMNVTCYIFRSKLYIVDAGLAFADDYEIGIDSKIPDLSELIECFSKVEAYFITHGHEDHVGALPLFLEKWPAPVYGTSWTLKILEDRVIKFGSRVSPTMIKVQAGDRVHGEGFSVDWTPMPHSIPQCCSLVLHNESWKILHTGDFKFDLNPPDPLSPNVEYLKSLAPITALISDSTNSLKEGLCPSETSVFEPLKECFEQAGGLIVFTTFSSNFYRLKTVIDLCVAINKKVVISGASLFKTLEIANELNVYTAPNGVIIDDSMIGQFPRDQVVVIASGSQGEPRSGLRRIVTGEHKTIRLLEGDSIVMSSRVIPGNEKSVHRIVSEANKRGVNVYDSRTHPGIHVSGHAHQEDLSSLIDLVQPIHHIPVHGTFTHLNANKRLHHSSISVENGVILELNEDEFSPKGMCEFPMKFVDSWSQRPLTYEEMRRRHKIGDSGLAIVTGSSNLVDIEFIGLPFDSDEASQQARSKLSQEIEKYFDKAESQENLNEWTRLHVRRYLSSLFTKKPVVISKLIARD